MCWRSIPDRPEARELFAWIPSEPRKDSTVLRSVVRLVFLALAVAALVFLAGALR